MHNKYLSEDLSYGKRVPNSCSSLKIHLTLYIRCKKYNHIPITETLLMQ